jgi:hypothetical protein
MKNQLSLCVEEFFCMGLHSANFSENKQPCGEVNIN